MYFDIHENGAVLRAFRNARQLDPALESIDWENQVLQMRRLGEVNNMVVHGSFDGKYWETTGLEFRDKRSLTMFLLRWA